MKNLIKVYLLILFLSLITSRIKAQFISQPEVTKIAEGYLFVEGPVYAGDNVWFFSDIPANTVYKWTPSDGAVAFLSPSGNSNGLAMDSEGRLILCQHGPRQVGRLEADGTITPLATHYNGKRFNSPNDLAIHSDGSIYFTDPTYGLGDRGIGEIGFNGIYRLSPSGEVHLLDSTVGMPNGIAFSPDETKLYVTDSEERRIFVWDVAEDTAITNKQQFAFQEPFGYTDGMKVDRDGYIYSTGPVGIWIYHPDGTLITRIEVSGQTSNCAFGGPGGKILVVTSGNAVYMIRDLED